MKLLHHTEMENNHWDEIFNVMYSPGLLQHFGITPSHSNNFNDFFDTYYEMLKADNLHLWGIMNNEDTVVGYVALNRSEIRPEWELGIAIEKKKNRTGFGAKAGLVVVDYAFQKLGADWIRFMPVADVDKVTTMLGKVGARKFDNYYILQKEWFDREKWRL